MKKLLILFSVLFALGASAQTLTISGTITDSTAQNWNGCTWTANLTQPANYNGTPVSSSPFTGACDSSGVFTSTGQFYNTTTLSPASTMYEVTVCSQTSAQCSVITTPVITGSQLISTLNAQIVTPKFPAIPAAYGYSDSEVWPIPLVGGAYWNTTLDSYRVWTGATWITSGGIYGGAVLLSPVGNQTITQPINTSFNVITSGTGTFESNGSPVATVAQTGPFYNYTALGDSITIGFLTNSPLTAYPSIISTFLGLGSEGVNNLGVPGYTTNNEDPLIFETALPQDNNGVITYAIGTNNFYTGGQDANQAENFGQNILAQGAFLAIPSSYRELATSFTKTGTWTTGVFTPDIATTTSGSTASFTVTGSVVYLATVMQAAVNTSAAATLSCDGSPTGATLYFTGFGGAAITNGQPQTSLTRVAGLSNTTHNCTVLNTGTGGTVELAWAAGISGSANPTFPFLYQGGIPSLSPDQPTLENLYRAYIPPMVSTLAGDGLNVFFANTNAAITNPGYYEDPTHPDQYGQFLLANVFITEIKSTAPNTSNLVQNPWYGAPVRNVAGGGAYNMLIGGFNSGEPPYYFSSMTSGSENVGMVGQTLQLTTGNLDTVLGWGALNAMTTGSQNTAIGAQSLQVVTTGSYNTAIGQAAMQTSPAATYNNTAVGQGALEQSSGANNTCVGYNCGILAVASSGQTYLGSNAGQIGPSSTVITNSTALGYNALVGANDATAIGANASNNIAYSVQLGDTAVTTVTAGNGLGVCLSNSVGCPSNSTQITMACATSGTATFSIPAAGTSDKRVLVYFNACIGAVTLGYPGGVTFTNIPGCFASPEVPCSVLTQIGTNYAIFTGAATPGTTGFLFLEGY